MLSSRVLQLGLIWYFTKAETCSKEIMDSFAVKSRNGHDTFGIDVSHPRNLKPSKGLYFGGTFKAYEAREDINPCIVGNVRGHVENVEIHSGVNHKDDSLNMLKRVDPNAADSDEAPSIAPLCERFSKP